MEKMYALLGRMVYWVIWPGSWLYLRRSQRTRLLLVCGDEILVIKNWLSAGEWKLPGGGLKRSEDPKIGMVRELEEETGVRLAAESVRLLSTETYRQHGFRYIGHFFAANIPSKPAVHVSPFEIVGYTWLKRSEVSPETCGPDIIRALELVQRLDSAKPL